MRKSLLLFVFLFILSAAVLAAGQGMVGAMGDDVTVTETTLAGDPLAADGLTVDLHLFYDYENHLEWRTSLAAGKDPQPETVCSFSAASRTDSRSDFPSVYMQIGGVNYGLSATGGEVDLSDEAEGLGFQAMLRPAADVAARTQAGETRTETVYLRDYYEYYTVSLDDYAYRELDPAHQAALSDYFKIPVPEELQVEVTVSKDPSGGVYAVECNCVEGSFNSYGCGLSTERGLILGLYSEADGETGRVQIDCSRIEGGYGVYLIPMEQGNLATDHIENIYPMDQTVEQYVTMEARADGKALLLFTRAQEQLVLTVLDLETLEIVQRLELPTDQSPEVWQQEDLLVLRVYDGSSRLLVLPWKNGAYRLWLDTPEYQYEGVWYSEPSISFDGARLAVAYFDKTYEAASFCLTVYGETGLSYAGRYVHNADGFYPKLNTSWSDALTLRWDA